jgi:hypothetical protein
LAVSMPTATILKKSTLKGTTSHGIWYSYKISSGLIKASLRNVPDKIDAESAEEGRKRRIIIRNRTKTICLTNFVWEP